MSLICNVKWIQENKKSKIQEYIFKMEMKSSMKGSMKYIFK